MRTYRGEILLLLGLVGWSAVVAFLGFPILGTLVLFAFGPCVAILLIAGAWRARDGGNSTPRQLLGLALLVLAVLALAWSSLEAIQLAHQWAVAAQAVRRVAPPPAGHWISNIASWLLPALLGGFGLRGWTSWSPARCAIWAAAVFLVPAAGLAMFWLVLMTDQPLTA